MDKRYEKLLRLKEETVEVPWPSHVIEFAVRNIAEIKKIKPEEVEENFAIEFLERSLARMLADDEE